MFQEPAPNSSSVWISIVQGVVTLGGIALSHWMSSRKVRDIKDINVAQSAQLGTVEKLVNGDRLALKLRIAELETKVKMAGGEP